MEITIWDKRMHGQLQRKFAFYWCFLFIVNTLYICINLKLDERINAQKADSPSFYFHCM